MTRKVVTKEIIECDAPKCTFENSSGREIGASQHRYDLGRYNWGAILELDLAFHAGCLHSMRAEDFLEIINKATKTGLAIAV